MKAKKLNERGLGRSFVGGRLLPPTAYSKIIGKSKTESMKTGLPAMKAGFVCLIRLSLSMVCNGLTGIMNVPAGPCFNFRPSTGIVPQSVYPVMTGGIEPGRGKRFDHPEKKLTRR